MKGSNDFNKTLVSVIIPCYNYGHFLSRAIESVRNQTYLNKEIIVVDDGSIDNTPKVAAIYNEVIYVYQENQGLSAARNLGASLSNGELLVFLDADDWLYPEALEINASYLIGDPSLQLVSGSFDLIQSSGIKTPAITNRFYKNHYQHLLEENYMAVPGSVMIRKKVFNSYKFDVTLRACEDYDLYLNISRDHLVWSHAQKVAAYYKHKNNMSNNLPLMLLSAMEILQKQKSRLRSVSEKESYAIGKKFWISYYSSQLYLGLITDKLIPTKEIMFLLLHYRPMFLVKFLVNKIRGLMYKKPLNKHEKNNLGNP